MSDQLTQEIAALKAERDRLADLCEGPLDYDTASEIEIEFREIVGQLNEKRAALKALQCDSNPNTGEVYTCNSLTCPAHGARNLEILGKGK